jgi:hypothetical protein
MALTISQAFTDLHNRQGLTATQKTTATTREGSLRTFFNNNFDMNEPVFAIGSYKRATICRGERDIDLMAPLRAFSANKYWERYKDDSSAFLYWVRSQLNDRYHATTVSSKKVCVKLDFSDIVTDVTPCFPRKGGGYLMPNGSGGWMNTNPPFHATFMANANTKLDGKLKPLVRLLKAWNIANSHYLSSFHMELMVEQIHRGTTIRSDPVEVAYSLGKLPELVRGRFDDPWPDGKRIDSYLTTANRNTAISILKDDAKRADDALECDRAGKTRDAFERWAIVYRHTFPAYG